MKLTHKALLTILTLTITLGLTTTARAAEPDAGRGLLRGTVIAIDGDVLTVQTRQTEVTLLTDAETVFEIPGLENPTLADLNIDDFVAIRAMRGAEGEPLARHVAVIPNGSLEDKVLKGIISAIDGDIFQLRTRRGQVTVAIGDQTLIRIPNVDDATVTDLEVKMPVVVTGQFAADDDQVLHASAVAVIPARVIKRHTVRGKLSAIEGDTLVLVTSRDGSETVRVHTTDETAFRVPGVENATIDDLKVDDLILALGQKDENDDFTAKSVAVVPQRPRRITVRGEVTAVGDASLTIQTLNGDELTALITEETQFRIPGDDDPGLDDIATGDLVGIVGHKDEQGSLVAGVVAALPEKARGHIVRGEVAAIEGTTLKIETPNGQVTVHTGEKTRFRIPGVENPGLKDIGIGDSIIAAGRWNEDGSLQAKVIGKLPQR